jgi:ABC-type transport system involved in multi-copper enzyme maturation permease subunit
MRWGLGPVFIYECLANSRRWQTYAIRSIGVAILLAAIAAIAMSHASRFPRNPWRGYADLGESYFYAIIGVELTLVMLAAPAATAGAICVDRARGTLTHMLVTDLSDAEIVLGKLAARLLPILGLVACTWPVLSIGSLLGGIDPTALTLAFAIILAVALLGCTMALALSVWARKPHEVVLATYAFWILDLLLWPMWSVLSRGGRGGRPPHWSLVADPYYLAFAPYSVPGRIGFWDYLGFFVAMLGASGVLTVLAIRRMRPVAARGSFDDRKEPRLGLAARLTRWLPGPSLDRNPVLWREWHRSRPSRWMMILTVVLGGSTAIACVVGAVTIWANGVDQVRTAMGPTAGMIGSLLQLIFGLLILSAAAPISMSEERQRGSLDLLATTTLSTPAIVLGKWLGTLRIVPLLTIGPGLVALALATAHKTPTPIPPGSMPEFHADLSRTELLYGAGLLVATILVHGALIASVGLALATWIKRQSRAIAGCVGLAVMVSAGWPMLVGVIRMGMEGQGMACLSPVVASFLFIDLLSIRIHQRRFLLWWTTFWDIECLVLAVGLLWLILRTFDGCFGRISERPRRTMVLSDVIVVLAGLGSVGGLFGAIAIRFQGLSRFSFGSGAGIVVATLLVTLGFLLLSVLAPSSITRGAMQRPLALESPAITGRRLVVGRWWEAFRLVPLLAVGPAFIAFAMVTARMPVWVFSETKTLPNGSTERIETVPEYGTYVITTNPSGSQSMRAATAEEIAAAPKFSPPWNPGGSSLTAVLVVITILAHGAAVVSLGVAMGIWFRRRGWAVANSVGLFLLLAVGWPILYLIVDYPTYDSRGLVLASPIPAILLLLLRMHADDVIAQINSLVAYWDLILVLLSVVVSGLAIRVVDRRFQCVLCRGRHKSQKAETRIMPRWK